MGRQLKSFSETGFIFVIFCTVSALCAQTSPSFSPEKMDTVLYGVAYYPEYMPYDRLDKDVELMQKAGITVVRVGESTWSSWEPRDGDFQFAWMQRVLDRFAVTTAAQLLAAAHAPGRGAGGAPVPGRGIGAHPRQTDPSDRGGGGQRRARGVDAGAFLEIGRVPRCQHDEAIHRLSSPSNVSIGTSVGLTDQIAVLLH